MHTAYKISCAFAALLLCLLFQQCTQDLPGPISQPRITGLNVLTNSAQKQIAQEKLLQSPFANKIASGEVTAQLAKTPITASNTSMGKDHAASLARQKEICYNFYLVYYINGDEVGRDFLYSECMTIGADDDTGGGGNGGGGNGDGTTTNPATLLPTTTLVNRPDIPVTDIKTYLKCFDTNAPATLTVYAQQPVPGTSDTYVFNGAVPDVGHSFISITQN